MRLGFHYHTPAVAQDGRVIMPAYLGLFVDSLAAHCEHLVCFQNQPNAAELPQMDYPLRAANVRLVPLGPRSAIPRRTLHAFMHRDLFRREQDSLDLMLVRASTPLLPVIDLAWKKPIALLLVSDAEIGLDNLPQPAWRKLLIRAWARWYTLQQTRIARKSLTFVNSKLIYDQLLGKVPHLIQTQTTTLTSQDFFSRPDTCLRSPVRLLYTGRMASSKGLLEIVTMVSRLLAEGEDVVLDLVGMTDPGEPNFLDKLKAVAASLGISQRVIYHGYKTAGPELLAYYRQADIYITAPQASSEGFPRTIWEAMGSSLPVVATEVGSIPAFIQGAAQLVPPRQPAALADAINALLANPNLRQQLIRKGMALARANTLEKRGEEMIEHMRAWLESQRVERP
jgi:glycosyltransferase involved in cell wall biosynthesis